VAKNMADKKKNTSRSQTAEMRTRTPEKARTTAEKPEKSVNEGTQPEKSVKAVAREERKEPVKRESKPASRREAKGPSRLEARIRQNRIGRFILEAYYELRHKVTWPTFDEAKNMTIMVILLSAVVGAILALADFGLIRLFLLIGGR
jgi:preprotein translocase SecE subunit